MNTSRTSSLLLALWLALVGWAATASAQFRVGPGGIIDIQNHSGAAWYFYDAPAPATAQMSRMSVDLTNPREWDSPQFRRDLDGVVSAIHPNESLRVAVGDTPAGGTVTVTYFTDASFDSSATLTVLVQAGNAEIVSLDRLDSLYTFANTVRWEAIFDTSMAGVRPGNFLLSTTGTLAPAPAITSVVPVPGSDFQRWKITANVAGTGAGQLKMQWAGHRTETPSADLIHVGPNYHIRSSGFTVAYGRTFYIQNQSNEAWHFGAGPSPGGTKMSRWNDTMYSVSVSLGDWGSPEFKIDPLAEKNRINPGEYLGVQAGNTPIGGTVSVDYFTESTGLNSLRIAVQNDTAQVTGITCLDASPRTAHTTRWRVTFDRPISGLRKTNISFTNWAGMNPSVLSLVPENGDYSRWVATISTSGRGSGLLGLNCRPAIDFTNIMEQPAITATVLGEQCYFNPIVLSMIPGGTIDLQNVEYGFWLFHVAPTPATAKMSRVGSSTVGTIPWGGGGFSENGSNSNNKVLLEEFLRVEAGSTPSDTPVVLRMYHTLLANDPGYTITIKQEVPAARVVSLNIIDPSPTVADSVRWDAVFDAPMSGISPANFRFINASAIEPTPSITSIVSVGSDGKRWRITASTAGTGIGLVGLRYIGHANETPAAPNTFTGQLYDFKPYPIILRDPAPRNLILPLGAAVPAMSVEATVRTDIPLHYQWKYGSSQDPLNAADVPGATATSFTPPIPTTYGRHGYFCRVSTTPGYNSDTLTSTIHVYKDPVGQIVPLNGSATLKVFEGNGCGLTYRWYEGESGDRTHPVAGATGAIFTTPGLSVNTRYWCLLSAGYQDDFAEKQTASALIRVVTMVKASQDVLNPPILGTIDNLSVRAFDSEGVPAAGVPISIQLSSLGHIGGEFAGGNFGGALYGGGSNSTNVITDEDGSASVPAFWTNTRAGTYNLIAICQGPDGFGAADLVVLNNQPLAVGGFEFITPIPVTLVAGAKFSVQVRIIDAWANVVHVPTTVTLSVATGTGTLLGVASVQSIDGVATFTGLSYLVAPKVTFRMSSGSFMKQMPETTITPGPISQFVIVAGQGQTAMPDAAFVQSLRAKLADASGNGIPNREVTFSAPASGASAIFTTESTVITDLNGDARVNVKANSISGTYAVNTLVTGLKINPAVFNLSNHTRIEAWRAANFAGEWRDTGLAADLAMPHADGVKNLLKYAFNLNATAADVTTMTTTGTKGLPLAGFDSQGRLTLTFVRRKAGAAPGITYAAQFSNATASGTFAPNPAATTSAPVSIDATWERVVVTDSVAAGPTQKARFARLVISNP